MKKLLTMKNVLIAIAFTVFLLFVKDHLDDFWGIVKLIMGILTPFFIGFLIAYILNFPYKFLYNRAFGKMGTKHKLLRGLRKPLALGITYVGTFAIIAVLLAILIPQIVANLSNLVQNFPGYYKSIEGSVRGFASSITNSNIPFVKDLTFDQVFNGITNFFMGGQNMTKLLLNATQSVVTNATSGVYNALMGVVISIYFLIYKEQLCHLTKRLAVAFIPIKYLPKLYEIVDITDTKCGRFLVGDILDAALISLIFFVTLSAFQFPYAPLIAVFCGVANIIPFFGPFIGAIPSAFILLLVDPMLVVWFVIITFIIQQIDGNILKPKIIGNQVGLSSFWVLFSVVLGGALFGIPGFILGTPIFAVIYSLVAKRTRNKIDSKGRIAQEALDFKVLNYAEIAEEQRRIRAEREHEQRQKLKKLIHIGGSGDEEEPGEENTGKFEDNIED